jgi:predicted phosphodiesterase
MRFLVISDIHANLAALEAVLADAEEEWDQIWCLGDVVGYGPDPNECASLLQEHDHLALSGNHDWAVLGKLDISTFNREAQQAIFWARQTVTEETREYLAELPPKQMTPPFALVHGSLRRPIWEYIMDQQTAALNFAEMDEEIPYCLVGHTHVAVVFVEEEGGKIATLAPQYGVPISLGERRMIINPGSVGQPRDSDPRAAYALLNMEAMTWEHRRVAYSISLTQERMREHDLPPRLIARLEHGW